MSNDLNKLSKNNMADEDSTPNQICCDQDITAGGA